MKMLCLFLALFAVTEAVAGHKRMDNDITLPTQKVLEYQIISNAVASDADRIIDGNAGADDASSVTVSSFLAQPDVPRTLVVTPKDSLGDVKEGDVVVTGKNARGQVITESFSFTDDDSVAKEGTKAFASVSSISFPQEDSPYATNWDVGVSTKLGFKWCMDSSPMVIKAWIGSTAETITVTADADELEKNIFTPTNVPDASRDYELLFIQNFRCD